MTAIGILMLAAGAFGLGLLVAWYVIFYVAFGPYEDDDADDAMDPRHG